MLTVRRIDAWPSDLDLPCEAYWSPHGRTVLYPSSAEPEEILDVVSRALFGRSLEDASCDRR